MYIVLWTSWLEDFRVRSVCKSSPTYILEQLISFRQWVHLLDLRKGSQCINKLKVCFPQVDEINISAQNSARFTPIIEGIRLKYKLSYVK